MTVCGRVSSIEALATAIDVIDRTVCIDYDN